jgi:hypothetical protein
LTRDGDVILKLDPTFGWSNLKREKIDAKVSIEPGGISDPRITLLILLSWYVAILTTYADYEGYVDGVTAAISAAVS